MVIKLMFPAMSLLIPKNWANWQTCPVTETGGETIMDGLLTVSTSVSGHGLPKMGCGFAQNTGVQLKFMQNLS